MALARVLEWLIPVRPSRALVIDVVLVVFLAGDGASLASGLDVRGSKAGRARLVAGEHERHEQACQDAEPAQIAHRCVLRASAQGRRHEVVVESMAFSIARNLLRPSH